MLVWARRYGSANPTAAGVSSVGVMGVPPVVPHAPKNAGPPKIPGEIGIVPGGSDNITIINIFPDKKQTLITACSLFTIAIITILHIKKAI